MLSTMYQAEVSDFYLIPDLFRASMLWVKLEINETSLKSYIIPSHVRGRGPRGYGIGPVCLSVLMLQKCTSGRTNERMES